MKYIVVRSASFVLAALIFAMVSGVAEAQTYCVLYAFSGSSDGSKPYGGLVLGSSNNLYGTTVSGGQGAGVVFQVKKNKCNQAENTVLHEFGSIKNDGLDPYGTLLIDPTGKRFLYGTTFYGGVTNSGTVFQLNIQGGEETIIDVEQHWGFANPYAGLGESSSAFYGTAYSGGTQSAGGVFGPNQLVLHNFGQDSMDGVNPYGGVAVSKGHIYGATRYGGGGNPANGTVYTVNTNRSGYKVLHRFLGTDGSQPYSKLLVDERTGNLYGTTLLGGKYNVGTIFEMSPTTGKILRQYHFGTQMNDGRLPIGNLVMDAEHNILGTTSGGGANGSGVIFKLDSTLQQLDVLHAFSYLDGTQPQGGLMMDSSGNLYGTASEGGVHASGTVFRLVP